MKGIVFNLLQEVVERELSAETWDALLEAAELNGAYTSLGSYSDEELMKLVQAAAAALDLPPDEVVRWFGRHALPLMAARYPQFFRGHQQTRPFLLTLNGIIHPEVLKLYPGAETPEFNYDLGSEAVLMMEYRSARRMCAFAIGLIEGAADFFREAAEIDHARCMLKGEESCTFAIRFSPTERAQG